MEILAMSDTDKQLRAAMYYVTRLGWAVIPVHTPNHNGCSCGDPECSSIGKHPRTPHGVNDGSIEPNTIKEWWVKWPDANIGIVTGKMSGLVVVDIDPKHGGLQTYDDLIDGYEKINTLQVITGSGGRHVYFKYPDDRKIGCPVGVLPGIDIRGDGGYVVAPLSKHTSGGQYLWEESSKPTQLDVATMPQWMLDALSPTGKENKSKKAAPLPDSIPEGERRKHILSLAGSMRRRGCTEVEILPAIKASNKARCKPLLTDQELEEIVRSVEKYPAGQPNEEVSSNGSDSIESEVPVPNGDPWPDPLKEAAFQGLAGEFVRAIEPHTESDPAALLIQFLLSYGSVIGRGPHFKAEADKHFTNEFAVVVGRTSKGRKGTSAGQIRRLFESIDEDWVKACCVPGGGLSTGEGLIWHVRDAVEDAEGEMTDVGVTDKRLLVQEPEFATVLKSMDRERNTLSPIVRTAWDGQPLRTLTKSSPMRASNTHISIVGHITAQELRRYMSETEAANGFGNRFIWFCANRSKLLPEGGQADRLDMSHLLTQLRDAVTFSREMGHTELSRDKAARDLWQRMYRALSREQPGLLGAVTGRAEAHVMRLALIYALLDRSDEIRVEHLNAAYALWQYAEASARYIFGTATGNTTSDRIRDAIDASGGMTSTEIYKDVFKSHKPSEQISTSLASLRAMGYIVDKEIITSGRPRTVWVPA